jgi:hypothetical protein
MCNFIHAADLGHRGSTKGPDQEAPARFSALCSDVRVGWPHLYRASQRRLPKGRRHGRAVPRRIQRAVDKGWMVRHESGTYVKLASFVFFCSGVSLRLGVDFFADLAIWPPGSLEKLSIGVDNWTIRKGAAPYVAAALTSGLAAALRSGRGTALAGFLVRSRPRGSWVPPSLWRAWPRRFHCSTNARSAFRSSTLPGACPPSLGMAPERNNEVFNCCSRASDPVSSMSASLELHHQSRAGSGAPHPSG